jgi:tripartite-type tricarboxylate transporter receptor subunit TctC
MKRLLSVAMAMTVGIGMLAGCASTGSTSPSSGTTDAPSASSSTSGKKESSFDNKRVRVVIGSTSTSGDSYMIADVVTRYLSKALNFNGKVDAVGASAALDAIKGAKGDGETIMMFHDMTYLGISFGAFDESYSLENMVVGPRIGINPGAAFAAKADAPYEDMKGIAEYLKANPDQKVRVAVEAGGVSHIAFISYYEWVKEAYGEDVASRVVVIVGGSTAEKSQMLWDGNCDVIFADYSSLKQYTEDGIDAQLKMKFTGLLDKIEGVDIPTFADQGITLGDEPFSFSKEFLIYLPKETPQEIVDELDAAMAIVSADPAFVEEMKKLTYADAYMPSAEAKTHIYEKRDSLTQLINEAPPLDDLTVQ